MTLTLSASQFEKFATAPRAWWARYVLKLPEKKTAAMKLGTAHHAVVERSLRDQEPFPVGWDEGITPADASLIRLMLASAEKDGIIDAARGRPVEVEFRLPLLPAEGDKPEVDVLGYIDVLAEDGIEDHKTTKSLAWAKSPEELRGNIQLLTYGKEWLRRRRVAGLPDPETVRLTHRYYVKEDATTATREARVTPAEIEAAWIEREKQARVMRDARIATQIYMERLDFSEQPVGAWWWAVSCAGSSPDEVRALSANRATACGSYGGCPYAMICGGVESIADYRRRITATSEKDERMLSNGTNGNGSTTGGTNVATTIFSQRLAAMASEGGTTPPPAPEPPKALTLPPATKAPPATSPTPSPAAPAAQVPQPAPAPAVAGAPCWAYGNCTACRGRGFRDTGVPCALCTSRARRDGRASADLFDVVFQDGEVFWEPKAEAVGQQGGSLRLVAPIGAAPASAVPTPPAASAPAATRHEAPVASQAPPTAPTPAPAPAPADGADVARKAKAKKGFTLCIGCAPRGESAIVLDEVFYKYARALAEEKHAVSYFALNAFDRRDSLATVAEAIVEAEKFGTRTVVVLSDSPDIRSFTDAIGMLADRVIVGMGR